MTLEGKEYHGEVVCENEKEMLVKFIGLPLYATDCKMTDSEIRERFPDYEYNQKNLNDSYFLRKKVRF